MADTDFGGASGEAPQQPGVAKPSESYVRRRKESKEVKLENVVTPPWSTAAGDAAQGGAKADNVEEASMRAWILRFLLGFSVVSGYFVAGTLFYMNIETEPGCESCAWTLIDALYFSVVTMSTVGYGDLTPSSTASQAFTLVYIFVGIIAVFPLIILGVQRSFHPIFEAARAPVEYIAPARRIEVDRDGIFGFEVPKSPVMYYAKNLTPDALIIMVFQVLTSAVFVLIEPAWTPWVAFYHCMVTATTVGYGDVAITTQAGRLCATMHILVSVAILGALIGDIEGLREKRAKSLLRAEQLKRKLDPDLIRKLDKDGNGVDKLEFVVGTLVHLRVVPQEEVNAYIKQFDKLDVDGDGRLTTADLVGLQKGLRQGHADSLRLLGATFSRRYFKRKSSPGHQPIATI